MDLNTGEATFKTREEILNINYKCLNDKCKIMFRKELKKVLERDNPGKYLHKGQKLQAIRLFNAKNYNDAVYKQIMALKLNYPNTEFYNELTCRTCSKITMKSYHKCGDKPRSPDAANFNRLVQQFCHTMPPVNSLPVPLPTFLRPDVASPRIKEQRWINSWVKYGDIETGTVTGTGTGT